MQVLVLIPAFFIFLYSYYKLIKDDYALMRKNISLEQSFDIVLLVALFGVIFSRLLFFIFHPGDSNIFLRFFSAPIEQFSLTGFIVGSLIGTYLVCKSKKAPLGRFADFMTMAFLIALPFGLLPQASFVKKAELIPHAVSIVIYLVFAIIFVKVLYKKLMTRTIREGKVTLLFLSIFSVVSFLSSVAVFYKDLSRLLNIQNYMLAGIFVLAIVLLLKQAVIKRK